MLAAGTPTGRPKVWDLQNVKDALAVMAPGDAPRKFREVCLLAEKPLSGMHRSTFAKFVAGLVESGWLTRTPAGYVRTPEEV